MKYLRAVFIEFGHSFLQWRKIVGVLLYDIVFSFLAFGAFYLTASLLNILGQSVEGFAQMPAAESTLTLLQAFIAKSAGIVLLFFIVLSALYGFFRTRMWSAVLGFKPHMKLYALAGLVSLIWIIMWFVFLVAVMKGLQPAYASFGLALFPFLYIHFTTLLHYFFYTSRHSWESAVKALSVGIGRFYWFVIPYIISIFVLVAWSQIWRLLPMPGDMFFAMMMLAVVILAPFFAWFRVYFAGLMRRVYRE